MYLAYLDESETHRNPEQWLVVGAALMHDSSFSLAELMSSFAIENLMPEERRKEFLEFHACELYGGYGPFEGIDQMKRFESIEFLLGLVSSCEMQVTYGAVNLDHLRKQPYASANPLDFAFRMCVNEVGQWLTQKMLKEIKAAPGSSLDAGGNLALVIVDECDKADKVVLQKSFRSMRKRVRPPDFDMGDLGFLHDDMYFGDSRYSIGIQIADLCSYFIARHLSGDEETERFYGMIEPRIFSSQKPQ